MSTAAGADDAELLAAHVAGDSDAFNELVRRHRDRLWAVALRTTCDPEEAADALQDALVSAFRRAETFRGDAQVTTWLHRIVVNACLDRLRRRGARPTDPLPEDEDRAAVLAVADANDSVAEAGERRVDVLAALRQISAEQRAAIALVDMEGYSVDEAARILDCAPGTVKSRCSRGRRELAALLEQYRPDSVADRAAPAVSHFGHGTGNPASASHVQPPSVLADDRPPNPPTTRHGGASS